MARAWGFLEVLSRPCVWAIFLLDQIGEIERRERQKENKPRLDNVWITKGFDEWRHNKRRHGPQAWPRVQRQTLRLNQKVNV